MSQGKPSRSLKQHIREEAVQWFVAFCEEEVNARACEEFNSWLRSSPEHVCAYLRVSAFWEEADGLSRHKRVAMEEIVQRALNESNVVTLGDARPDTPPTVQRQNLRPLRYVLAASVAVVCVGTALFAWFFYYRTPTFSTATGEQRTITLADGSTVSLNARTLIRVKYSQTRREITLQEGQAFFNVARSTTRPFIVHSDDANVRALGTQFDVYERHGETIVTVVEGRVAVSGHGTDEPPPFRAPSKNTTSLRSGTAAIPLDVHGLQPLLVSAGERVIATPHTLEAPQSANTAAATAWTEGRLVFESASLSDVLEEFNRYLPKRLVTGDAKLMNIHISGVFGVTESAQFVEFLHQRFGTVSHETDDEIRIARD